MEAQGPGLQRALAQFGLPIRQYLQPCDSSLRFRRGGLRAAVALSDPPTAILLFPT